MRVKSKAVFSYGGVAYVPEDVFDVPDPEGRDLLNRDLVIPFNLEDPGARSWGQNITEKVPDVPAVQLNPQSDAIAAAGGTGSFTVTMTSPGLSGTWSVSKDSTADWLTINSPTQPQTDSGTVNYTVDPNATGSSRAASMYVNGKTFTVNQVAGVSVRSKK